MLQDGNRVAAEHTKGTEPAADGVGSSKQTVVSALLFVQTCNLAKGRLARKWTVMDLCGNNGCLFMFALWQLQPTDASAMAIDEPGSLKVEPDNSNKLQDQPSVHQKP